MRRSVMASRGVTLIELVITIAIVGLLAAVAVPSYQQYIRKGERQKGADCVMQVHNRAQVFYQNRNAYPASLAELQLANPYPCPESRYEVVFDASYDRLTSTQCTSSAKYQLRARARTGESSQARDGELVLGFCNQIDPNRRLIRDREVSGVKKTWDDN